MVLGSQLHSLLLERADQVQRFREAKELLKSGQSVTDTAFALGFSSSQYFAAVFKKWAGITPSDYLSKLAGEK